MLDQLIRDAETVSPDDQLRLAAHLVERARQLCTPRTSRRKWRDIRGAAKPSMFGEDAQAWVTRTRRESDEQRQKAIDE